MIWRCVTVRVTMFTMIICMHTAYMHVYTVGLTHEHLVKIPIMTFVYMLAWHVMT